MTYVRVSIISCMTLLMGLALTVASRSLAAESSESPFLDWSEGPAEEGSRGGALLSMRVAGTALRPRTTDVSQSTSSSGGCAYASAGSALAVWNFAVTDLPQGARVDTLRMYYYDTSASNSNAWFTVYDLYGNIVDEWNVVSAGNAGNSFNDSVVIDHVIDYSTYSYLLNWRPVVIGSDLQLCGFRIFYQP